MAAVYSHDLPTALPAAPSSSTSTRGGTRKRTSSPQQTDEEAAEPVQPKAKRVRSTQQEKNAKKVARMERNRVAAQVSRDRKKQQTEYLAQRVAELEAQLVSGPSPAASISASFSTISPSPTFALPALPLPPPTPAADPLLVGQLKEENESLKKQLALEKLASQALQIRLSSLEAKFGRLEQLLSGGFGADVKPAVVKVKQEEQEKTNVEQGAKESHSLLPVSSVSSSLTEKDSSRLVAREVDQSLQRKLSHPSSTTITNITSATTTSTTSPLLSTSPSLLLPPRAFNSTSTSTSSRPSLHQILSSIKVLSPLSPRSLRTTSLRPGRTGRTSSTPLRLSTSSSRLSSRRARTSISSSSSAKMSLRDQRRWKLVVRR